MVNMTPRYPALYQINTRVYVNAIGRMAQRAATLDDIPDDALDEWAEQGFDWIYLLGVWQTGAAARQRSRTNPEWLAEFRDLLPDLSDDDICGSCFAVTGYTVHKGLGGNAALRRLRQRLNSRGLRLMLDFVPNHTAPDHPWVSRRPDYYVRGTEELLAQQPQNYTRVESTPGAPIYAYGRDPYFPGWPDTLQLNYGNPALQAAMAAELAKAAALCDGLRCDMAMLILPDIFQRTWGVVTAPFWPPAIEAIRAQRPDFVFMAEVYWDLEWTLQQQGFTYTYDKRLYDRLHAGQAQPVREHFWASAEFQEHSARFLENHDEPRVAAAFSYEMHLPAALLTFLCPGLRFIHQGQMQGWQQRISPHLCRGPVQPTEPEIAAFYRRLLELLRHDIVRNGAWQLLESIGAWEGNWTSESIIAFAWSDGADHQWLVTVNYAPNQSQCYLRLPFPAWRGRSIRLDDQLSDAVYVRDGNELADRGLYLDLPPWGYHVFEVNQT